MVLIAIREIINLIVNTVLSLVSLFLLLHSTDSISYQSTFTLFHYEQCSVFYNNNKILYATKSNRNIRINKVTVTLYLNYLFLVLSSTQSAEYVPAPNINPAECSLYCTGVF